MGLTIHWEQKDKDQIISDETARQCIDFVKDIANREGWEIFAEFEEVIDTDRFEAPDWRNTVMKKIPENVPKQLKQFGISVQPHKDCETVLLSFAGGKLRHFNDFGQPERTGWISDSQFCKTHYAGFATHRKVCRLLQAIDKHFIPLEVSDEGSYYGIWNDEKGQKRFGEYVAFVKGVGDQLTNTFGGENVLDQHNNTDGWKHDYIDELARQQQNKNSGKKDNGTNPVGA